MTMPNATPDPAARVFDGDRAADPGAPEPVAAGNGAGGSEGSGGAPAGEELPQEGYRVHLERFDGPLDLLLHLIKRDEIDIYDIPIAHITDQYLASIEEIERLDLDLDRAGDFLLMAATLMRIKARMLVPRDEDQEEDEEEIDPREELMRRLLEYQEFKRIAEVLRGREDEWREIFFRPGSLRPVPESGDDEDLGVSLVDLFRAFRQLLDQLEEERPLAMISEEYSVDERMDFIRESCAESGEGVPFHRLFERSSRAMMIATFLGLLELIRLREIVADQVDRFGEIWIRPRKEDVVAP